MRTIVIRYARTTAGALVGSVTALDDDTTIFLEARSPWNEGGTFDVDGRGIVATTPGLDDPTTVGHFRLQPTRPPDQQGAYSSIASMVAAMTGKPSTAGHATAAMRYTLNAGDTITFGAEVADHSIDTAAPSRGQVLGTLAHARAKVDDGNLSGSGPVGQAAGPMRSAIALNANYDEKARHQFVMWGWGGGGDDIFTGWDSGWDAITAASVDPALALDHERDLFAAGGPRYNQENAGPMHAYAVWRLFARYGDRDLLNTAYPTLVTFFDKLPEWDVNHDGLLESPYGGDRIGGRGNHLGLDDSPVYANYQRIPKVGGSGDPRDNTNLTDVALNSYYALFAESLAKMATVLGRPADAQRFTATFDTVKQEVNAQLWNPERGLYLSRYLDGSWDPVETPTVFYPMFGGIATADRANELVHDHLLDPAQFWGDYVIPSVSRSDPHYCAAGHIHPSSANYKFFQRWGEENSCEEWQGASWPPMNATVYDGLKRYGFDVEAGELAAKTTAMWLDTWNKDNWFAEYYDPEPGQLIMDSAVDTAWRTYSWSNLMELAGVHELIADEPWGDPEGLRFGTLGLPGTNAVRDVPFHGHKYDVSAAPQLTRLDEDGHQVFRAQGARVVVRNFVLTDTGASFEVKADGPVDVTVFPRGGGAPRRAQVGPGVTPVRL
jgi:hypothetical protein